MARLRVSSTKSNLLRLRDELTFAREGKELLTQKREVLVMELLRLQDDARKAREELDDLLEQAYRIFISAALVIGMDDLRRIGVALPAAPDLRIEVRSVMGVVVPIVHGKKQNWEPCYGLARPGIEADRAVNLFLEVEKKILEVAEIETAIYRIAVETRKTLRRERALENFFIPQYRDTVRFIQESLEEKERESFFQMKLLKKR